MKFEPTKEKIITIIVNEDKTLSIHKDKTILRKEFEQIIETILESLYSAE